MRLTNCMRDAFIRAVMDDVPMVDYNAELKQVVLAANQDRFEREIQGVLYSTALRSDWIATNYYHPGIAGLSSVAIVGPVSQFRDNPQVQRRIDEVVAKHKVQRSKREALRDSLRQVAYGARTRKQLAAALPEFEKYLPADEPAPLRSAPVLTNVVPDFVQAGWPRLGAAVQSISANT